MSSLGFGLMLGVETYTVIKGPESGRRNVCPGSEPHFVGVLQFSQAGSVVMNRSRTFH